MRAILILITIISLSSCTEYGPDYNYSYKVDVTYTDSSRDTIEFGRDSFKGNKVGVYMKISDNGLLTSSSVNSCIMIGCGFYQRPVVCGVRKYEILEEIKTPIEAIR